MRRAAHMLLAGLIAAVAAGGGEPPISAGADADAQAAVARGLVFLATGQTADGAFAAGPNAVAITGLGLLAFLSAGHAPGPGRYGLTVARAVDYIAAAVPADGYVGRVDGSRMYGQAIATAALAEAAGAETDPERRQVSLDALRKTVGVILRAQGVHKADAFAGGWRYEPDSGDSDLSLSAWNALALRAAAGAGVDVPRAARESAAGFVARCRHAQTGGFAYQPGVDVGTGATAAGVLALNLLGDEGRRRPELAGAVRYLLTRRLAAGDKFFHYQAFHFSHAAQQVGEAARFETEAWLVPLLLSLQQPDGGWQAPASAEEPGRPYATAMSILSITAGWRVLPVAGR